MSVTIAQFKKFLEDTVPEIFDPSPNHRIPGDPWKSYNFICEVCREEWEENQKVGTKGLICPACGDSDPDYVWD